MRTSTGSLPTDKLFTGQQQESGDALGLYNYGARFYSTAIGRFMSVDPVVGNARNPQSWNAYSYAGNNPLRYTDPTGMRRTDQIEADEESFHEQRDLDELVGALLYLDAQNQQAAVWASQEPHACQLCADWGAAADAYAAAASSSSGGDGGGGVGGLFGKIGRAIVAGTVAAAENPWVEKAAGNVVVPGLGAAAVPVGLALLGVVAAPCDSKGCTTVLDAREIRTPDGEIIKVRDLPKGEARKIHRQLREVKGGGDAGAAADGRANPDVAVDKNGDIWIIPHGLNKGYPSGFTRDELPNLEE